MIETMKKAKKLKKANSRFDFLFGNKNLLKSKRSQHEIVGFVLIVVIVVVIGLFLLVFYLRQPTLETKSLNVQNFLQASMLYTTECSLSIDFLELQELTKSCKENEICKNGKPACEVLNTTLSQLIYTSWAVSEEKPVKAYSLNLAYEEKIRNETLSEDILNLEKGNCTGSSSRAGAEHFLYHMSGNIVIAMEICYEGT